MIPDTQDTFFDILKGDIILDFYSEITMLKSKIQEIENNIRTNDWWHSRKKKANQARNTLAYFYNRKRALEDFMQDIINHNNLECDYYNIFDKYRVSIKITKKEKTA